MASKHSASRRRRPVVAAAVVVILGGGVGALVATLFNGPAAKSSSSATGISKPEAAAKVSATCPLTDLPAPQGGVPQRPALAIKVGNDPGARPQSGLSEADIVYEVQAEGGITRLIAVYQCNAPALVGPIRSLRWVDWHVVGQLGNPILVFAGGIIPDVNQVFQQGWLFHVDALSFSGSPFVRTANRVPPENLYGSPAGIWGLDHSSKPPAPVFSFSEAEPSGGETVSSINLPYSGASNITWSWSAAKGEWLRYYSGVPALGNGGEQLSATNVVVEYVNAPPGPYNESGPNSPGVRSQTIGSGSAWVLRNGKLYQATWNRPSLASPTSFVTASGTKLAMSPGRTWVEIVPNWVHGTIQ